MKRLLFAAGAMLLLATQQAAAEKFILGEPSHEMSNQPTAAPTPRYT